MKREFYCIYWENNKQCSQTVDNVAQFLCKLLYYSNNGYNISNVTFYSV